MCKSSKLTEIQLKTLNGENKENLVKFKKNKKLYKKEISIRKE